jgi:hypothetical protein
VSELDAILDPDSRDHSLRLGSVCDVYDVCDVNDMASSSTLVSPSPPSPI